MKKNDCCENFIELYANDDTRGEALEKANNCLTCLDKIVHLEMTLLNARKNMSRVGEALKLSENKIISMADEFLQHGEDNISEKGDWSVLFENTSDLNLFQELIHSLKVTAHSDGYKTPVYLKNIVMNSFKTKSLEKNKNTIVIRLKEKLQLLGAFADNVFHLPSQSEAFSVRSTSALAQDAAGVLQFYTQEEDEDEKVLYQVVKDGKETIMLTVKLQNFHQLPRLMKISRENRLISSFFMKEDFAYFPQLTAGTYNIELKDKYGETVKSVDIDLVDE